MRLTGSRDDAHDLAQEAFLRAWQALPGWRPEAKFATWLFGIARNAAIDLLRRRGVVEAVAPADLPERPDTSSEPFARLEATQRLALLERALAALSPEHREILLLRELENMVEQAVALSSGGVITADDILPQAPRKPSKTTGRTLADIVDDAEREAAAAALRASDGRRGRAACRRSGRVGRKHAVSESV